MKIYLATCFSLDFDLPLLKHFVEHYLSMGIAPENFLLVLNVFKDKTKLQEGLTTLSEYGIFPKDIWCYEYESHEKWQRVHMMLSAHVSPEDWVVHPDSDEFFQFPYKLSDLTMILDQKNINAAITKANSLTDVTATAKDRANIKAADTALRKASHNALNAKQQKALATLLFNSDKIYYNALMLHIIFGAIMGFIAGCILHEDYSKEKRIGKIW